MRVRTYDEIDPLAAFRLGVVSFGSAWDEAKVRRVRAHDRTYLEEFALYAEERGRVLAQVVPRRLAVRTTNGVEEVGGLAAVCSHPGVWGRGFARRLIEATHDRFRELGLSVSALTTSRNIRRSGGEAKAEAGIATVNWITARSDVTRFRSLGYTVDGPFPDTTMAVSLVKEIRTTDLARRFGGTTGKFVQYPTDDF